MFSCLNSARQDICESQEAWWLRKGCRRARCRLLKGLADAFEIPIKSVQVPLLYLALEHVVDSEGLQQRAPERVEHAVARLRGSVKERVLEHLLPGCAPPPPNIRRPQDIQAHRDGELAAFTSDTVEHDILPFGGDEIGVYNMCTDTTRHMNGIVTNMHPSEGVWLFRCARASHVWPRAHLDQPACVAVQAPRVLSGTMLRMRTNEPLSRHAMIQVS